MLKDKFVTGLQRGPVLNRLGEEEHTTSLEGILNVTRKKEAAVMFSRQVNTSVHKIQPPSKANAREIEEDRNSFKCSRK